MIVWNHRTASFQMSAAVINMWALPSPSKQIRGDGCYDSGLSGGYRAACYGTVVTLCNTKPGVTALTANGAIDIPAVSSSRITLVSPAIPVTTSDSAAPATPAPA